NFLIIRVIIVMLHTLLFQPLSPEQRVLEGADVSLSCSYSVTVQGLQWYRQYPGSEPKFLISLTEFKNESLPALRLTAVADKVKKQVDLKISRTAVSDSALYYCALVPTVTGNTDTLYKNTLHSHSTSNYLF
uniref:Ig-like domain-containing protein n=2 Tax=Astyanax mexicanus TaxID=7994 RepID=A0A8B9LMR2_ASTMX